VSGEASGAGRDSPDQPQRRFEEFLSRFLAVPKKELDELLAAQPKHQRRRASTPRDKPKE